jgi:predicted nucleotidyltransferase
MEQRAIIAAVHRIVEAHLASRYRLVLFGSVARGTDSAGSDIDLAIVGPRPVDHHTMALIHQAVAEIRTLRKIDLLDAAAAGPALRAEIDRDATLV